MEIEFSGVLKTARARRNDFMRGEPCILMGHPFISFSTAKTPTAMCSSGRAGPSTSRASREPCHCTINRRVRRRPHISARRAAVHETSPQCPLAATPREFASERRARDRAAG